MNSIQMLSVPKSNAHSTMATSVRTSPLCIIVPAASFSNITPNSRNSTEIPPNSMEQVSIPSYRGQSSPWQFLTSSIEFTAARVDRVDLRKHIEQLAKEDQTTFSEIKNFLLESPT
jgi:hypothetical protein